MLAGLRQPLRGDEQVESGWDARRADLIKELEAERREQEAERRKEARGERAGAVMGCVVVFGPLIGAVLALIGALIATPLGLSGTPIAIGLGIVSLIAAALWAALASTSGRTSYRQEPMTTAAKSSRDV